MDTHLQQYVDQDGCDVVRRGSAALGRENNEVLDGLAAAHHARHFVPRRLVRIDDRNLGLRGWPRAFAVVLLNHRASPTSILYKPSECVAPGDRV